MTLRVENLESGHVARVAWTTTPADYSITGQDPFKGNLPGLSAPSEGRPCRRIVCGSSGSLVITGLDGVDVTFPVSSAGQVIDLQASGLKGSGTTVTNVVVIW